MIEPQFLSVTELAVRWTATERQILEHGSLLRIPIFFLFDGLAFLPSERWLMGHGAHEVQLELANKRALASEWDDLIKRNAAGLTDMYSRLDDQQVIDLRKKITDYEHRIEELDVLLEGRSRQRKSKSVFGYLRLPPRTIVDIQEQGIIPFPHLAINQSGELMTLEPGITGKWKDTLSVGDLLIPLADIKSIETRQAQLDEVPVSTGNPNDLPKPAPRQRTQESAILATIRSLGYEPQALPKQQPGKAWVPSEVWAILKKDTNNFISQGVFDKAWARLKKSRDIVISE
ncbi:hypothetical protein [Pseudomonas amygdali]|uniref:hypothetical protein n=1 Tax=Pseudomonas amygdali TaxID=47877 RepID=UPI0039F5F814